MSNSEDPDEMAHYEPSHLELCCLQKPIIIACGSERLILCVYVCVCVCVCVCMCVCDVFHLYQGSFGASQLTFNCQ